MALTAAQEELPLRKVYGELARAICQNLRAEAALAKLDSGAPVALNKPGLFRKLLQSRWERVEPDLTSERREISKQWLKTWRANSR